MRALGLYVWKEWRDHRAVVIGLLIGLPVVLAAAAALLPTHLFARALRYVVVGSLLVAAFAIGGDLIPGEARRGRLDFLRRLPCDLSQAFWGKVIFLLGVYALFPAYGLGVAWAAGRLSGGAAWAPDLLLAGAGLAVALWTFAVACWLPRGALASPATLLVLGLFALPIGLVWWEHSEMPLRSGLIIFGVLLATAAPLVAWWSFARGMKFGRGIGASAWRGLVATALIFAPAYGYTAHELHDYYSVDPLDPQFEIVEGWLGDGGRYAFVNVRNGGPRHAVVVDLRDGTFERRGDPGDRFGHPEPRRKTVFVIQRVTSQRGRDGAWCEYIDAGTAATLKSGWIVLLEETFAVRFAAAAQLHVPAAIGAHREHYILIHNKRQLARVRIDGAGEREVLFPR